MVRRRSLRPDRVAPVPVRTITSPLARIMISCSLSRNHYDANEGNTSYLFLAYPFRTHMLRILPTALAYNVQIYALTLSFNRAWVSLVHGMMAGGNLFISRQ